MTQQPPQTPSEWDFSTLTLADVLAVIRSQNDTNMRRALGTLLVIAQRFSKTPLENYPPTAVLFQFVEAMYAHVVANAEADYLSTRDTTRDTTHAEAEGGER